MTVTFVGAIAALVGVVLGSVLNRGAEYRRWSRSESHAACVRLLTVAEEVRGKWARPGRIARELRRTLLPTAIKARQRSTSADSQQSAELAPGQNEEANPDERVRSAISYILTKRFGFDRAILMREFGDLHDRLLAAREEVRLLCPDVVTGYAALLVNAAIAVGDARSEEDWKDKTENYRRLRREFVFQARAYLHSPFRARMRRLVQPIVRFLYRGRH